MRVGISRAQTYAPIASRFQVSPSALGERPEPDASVRRSELFQRAARPMVNAVPDDRLRGAQVGRVVINRTLSAQEQGVMAYRRQDEQMNAWRGWSPQERTQSMIRPEVSSALGGASRGAGAILDQRV